MFNKQQTNFRATRGGRRNAVVLASALAVTVGLGSLLGASEGIAAVSAPKVFIGDGRGGTVATDADSLVAAARTRGRIPVMVRLDVDFVAEGELSTFQAANQQTAIANLTAGVVARVSGAQNIKTYESVPLVAMSVDAAGLRALLADPRVVKVTEDVAVPPTLHQSVPLIKANKVWKKGKTGKGYAVAVLDTGVQRNHKSLKGKIVKEACFSTTDSGSGSKSACPGGKASSTKSGSGSYCDLAYEGCDHGTHVSGIAVGNPSNKYKGVAKGGNLIPIQVFSEFPASYSSCGGSKCALSYTSDQVKALEHVKKLAKKTKIASVNMSLGGGQHSSACDTDDRKMAIDNLVSKKIAVAIASGNNGYDGFVNAPGCISSAVTVGSTTKSDAVSSFSNHAGLVDLMAPGSDIKSSIPGNKYVAWDGTSMATPHVAGTWALMRQTKAKAEVHEVLRALICTGVDVKRASLTKPRINVLSAWKVLKRPDGSQSWNFSKQKQVDDWDHDLGKWKLKSGNMYVDGRSSTIWLAATSPFCSSNLKVNARVKRKPALHGTSTYYNSGMFLFSKIDKDKNMSGYWFAYNGSDTDTGNNKKRGQAVIWRMDGYNGKTNTGSASLLCTANDIKVRENDYNDLQVVSKSGAHVFYVNGKSVCSKVDATYQVGYVAVVMAKPASDKSHKYWVDSASVKQLSATDPIASGPASVPLDIPAGVTPLGVGVDGDMAQAR